MTWLDILDALRVLQPGWEPIGYAASGTPDRQVIRITVRRNEEVDRG